jgi:hypothetical protein
VTHCGPELAARLAGHKPGPEQDWRARLVVVARMAESGHDHRAIAQVLQALALLPGQESERDKTVTNLRASGEPQCGPKTTGRTYI